MRCGVLWIAAMWMASVAGAAGPKVLLLPFEPVGAADRTWVSKALQQNLVAEISRSGGVQPVAGSEMTTEMSAALAAAERAGAQFVIFGSYQVAETDLRITGQVVEVPTRQVVGGLKATGSQRDLFGLEDLIAQQARHALPQAVAQPQQVQPEMLKQAEAQPKPEEPRIVPFDAWKRARELEDQIDRAVERMRFAIDDASDNSYYYNSYYYRPYSFYPYGFYPTYYSGIGTGYCSQTNIAVIGGYRGKNWNVGFRVGGGQNHIGGPSGNYIRHPQMNFTGKTR